MAKYLSGTYSSTYTLTTNPTTVTSTGTIDVNSTSAYVPGILGPLGVAWTLTNLGTVESIGSLGVGIRLQSGGSITNGQGGSTAGLIEGSRDGIQINGAGTIVNHGTISQTGTAGYIAIYVSGSGTVTNFGVIENVSTAHSAINIAGSGVVTNAAGATIASRRNAITFNGTAASTAGLETVVNSGRIQSTGATAGDGVYFGQGGVLTNTTSGRITAYHIGISVHNTAGTIVNFGTIVSTGTGTSGNAIFLGAGGMVTNYGLLSGAQSGSPISGTSGGYPGVISARSQRATVANLGRITNTNNSNGVNLLDGGLLSNGSTSATSALISAPHSAVYMGGTLGVPTPGAIGTVVNYGTIQNTTTESSAVRLVGGSVINHGLISGARTGISFGNTAGTVVNFGTVRSTAPTTFTAGVGIYLQSGGLITNAAGASITALRSAIGIGHTAATSAAAIVNNAGTITGSIGVSVGLADTGKNTVVNSGRITGTGGTAVQFGAGNDTLIVKPGAVFAGAVSGGGGTNTIIQSAAGTLKVTGFSGFETIRLANGAADSLTLTNANFTGVTGSSIAVDGGNAGNTVNASALTGANRVIVVGGAGVDHFSGGAGNDIFKFSVANLAGSDTVAGGAGGDKLLMTTAGTIKAGGISGVETFQLAGGAINNLTLTSANFTNVSGHVITVNDGNSGNTVTPRGCPRQTRSSSMPELAPIR